MENEIANPLKNMTVVYCYSYPIKKPPNKACTPAEYAGAEPAVRLGLGAFFELVLNDSSFPFRELVFPSRTPKGHTPAHHAGVCRWALFSQV
jgi:hypothetical protein